MKKKNVTICLNDEAIKRLRELAKREKRSMSQMIEVLILKMK
jgi:predicted CopG family antitoxin